MKTTKMLDLSLPKDFCNSTVEQISEVMIIDNYFKKNIAIIGIYTKAKSVLSSTVTATFSG